MRITDLLNPEGMDLQAKVSSKAEAIDHLVALMEKTGNVKNMEVYKESVLAREKEGSTGIGEGVAIPHAKTNAVTKAGLSVMIVPEGVDYDSLDGQPTYLFFLIAAPDTEDNVHLDVLGRLSVLLMDDDFRQNLMKAQTTEEFCHYIDEAETEKFAKEDAKEALKEIKTGYRILAVTACPTGIAHTYMAAESLETKAGQMGITIKVETNGSGGTKNKLTKEEIEKADAIIIAADKNVEMTRFDGKPVVITKVANGISKPEELIKEALSGNAPLYHADHKAEDDGAKEEKENAGRRVYKHLMNGVSHMLPFVIGGGILIALSFLFDGASAGTDKFGVGNAFAAFLNSVGKVAFGMMMPILAGYIAYSIADRPGLAAGIVGGLLASAGGSGFFGALIAGFAAGYLVVLIKWLVSRLPQSLEGIKPVLIYPLFGILGIGAIMTFVVNPPMSVFNMWLNNALTSMGEGSRIALGVILGGMMSIDFGGPFNKAAYVFGTASLASGQYDIMAAVMIGGMVPPLAIALCTLFFKNRFTKKERQSGITNFIMGLSFITEGAIPFAASDPLRVIPSCIIGSAVAGALSMAFRCTLMAPHGGIFVIGIVGHPLLYLLALAIGSVVAMILLAILKKPIQEEN